MRKMKTKLLVILCVLIFAGAAMVGPVAGAPTSTSNITGNPDSYISVAVNESAATITLTTDSQNVQGPLEVNVTANTVGWTLKAQDAMALVDPHKTATEGHMADWVTSGTPAWADPIVILISPMRIQGSLDSVATQAGVVTLSAVGGGTLETGLDSTPTTGTKFTMTTWQPVEVNDVHLPTDHVYRIVLLFTGTAA
jgi:hypothetical protein